MMSELIAFCHMLPPEILKKICRKVIAAKLQERQDMGWGLVLRDIRQLEKRKFYESFWKTGKRKTRNVEEFMDWQVDYIDEWALNVALKDHRPIWCGVCEMYTLCCWCD